MKTYKQLNLFNCEIKNAITISEAANLFSVSSATIRNWIKTGYLEIIEKGKVSYHSVIYFRQHHFGKDKLTQRANKLQKTNDNKKKISSFFFNDYIGVPSEKLGAIYENTLSESYKNKEGVYYTPPNIVTHLFKLFDDIKDKTFCDPCCGSGNFIIQAIDLGFNPENIYGFDIDPIAVEITKKRIYEKTGYLTNNIVCLDFLNLDKYIKYDYIYTNPPWGKKINKKEKIEISNKLNTSLNNDTCALFFSACLNCLNSNGILGLILPESFYNVSGFEEARKELLKYEIKYLSDYGKAFKGLQTGAVSFILRKCKVENPLILCEYFGSTFYRTRKSFVNNPKNIINLYCNKDEEEVINYLLSIPHINLSKNIKWGLGIVTGNNKEHIKKEQESKLIPIFKGCDISKEGLRKPTNFIYPDFSVYQQVAPLELFNSKEKLIYRFISSDLCFYYDDKQRFVLNSANMLVLDGDFPLSMKTLSAVLNCDITNWIFKKIFNTHKILRGDLEFIPIFNQFIENDVFSYDKYLEKLNIERGNNGTFRIKS